jgi:phage tail-like protein
MSDPLRVVGYTYLNRDPPWAGFDLTRLERLGDGSLVLTRAPLPVEDVGLTPPDGAAPASAGAGTGDGSRADPAAGPAGVAVDRGDLYSSDPGAHRVSRFNRCLPQPEPLPCISGPGPWPGQLDTPRGIAILPEAAGTQLAVAEEGNHRVQVFDVATGQSLFVVGKAGPDGKPQPGNGPGEFNGPWGLAADGAGNLYVADHGNGRVQKLGPRGKPDTGFAATLAAQPGPQSPVAVCIAGPAGQERLYVLDMAGGSGRVLVFDTQGKTQLPKSFPAAEAATPMALAVTGGSIYVGSLDGSVARYDVAGRFLSRFAGTDSSRPIRALAVETSGTLLACPGGWPLTRINPVGGYVRSGHFQAGPLAVSVPPMAWHRWQVEADAMAAAASVQLFSLVALAGTDPPAPVSDDDPFPASADPEKPGWSALPRNQLEVVILDDDARAALAGKPTANGPDADPDDPPRVVWIWVAGRLEGDGLVSPVLRQMRIDVAPGSSLRYLPRIYREGSISTPGPGAADAELTRHRLSSLRSRLVLDLWLAALDAELGRTAAALAGLPRRFDPAAAPTDGLPWLASWLDFDWVETWPEADARRYLAEAFGLGEIRGTVEGLRRYLKIYAGVTAWVEAPSALNGGAPLMLGESSTLGFDAVLAPAPAYGAVLASTATLDHSHLLDPAEGGVPLFGDVAHRFCVQVHAAEVTAAGALDTLKAVLAREAPAHTSYHLCVLPPRMRVGFQARLGLDTVVAGPMPDLNLAAAWATTATAPGGGPTLLGSLGVSAVLADQPRRSSRLGEGARVGGILSSS